LPYSDIEAVIHPQSVVHSLVEFNDGSTIAQASSPNMKGAIAYAMNWPDRLNKSTAPIDWSIPHTWTFAPINAKQFPSVDLARHCGEVGGGLPAIFNAANEVAVAAFISKKLEFKSIVGVIAGVVADLEKVSPKTLRDLSDVSALEDDARTRAQAHLLRLAP
jgi:1-deoxy-D-xylulose-5-phosphate reductoisomerase